MSIKNIEIAEVLSQTADLLEIEGANRFRVRAYREAANVLRNLPTEVEEMRAGGQDLATLPGIGHDLARKITELVRTGRLQQHEEIKLRFPAELTELLKFPGLGPRRARVLYDRLGITTLEGLAQAARQGQIRVLPGFGTRLEWSILDELERTRGQNQRRLRADAEADVEHLLAYLEQDRRIQEVAIAGSFRRCQETVGDLDFVAASAAGRVVIERFVRYGEIQKISSQGPTRSSVVLKSGLEVDLRVVPRESFGATLFYFTGARSHHLALRNRALEKGWKLNEYGLFEGDERLAGHTEEEIYQAFGLPYIVPELREDRGEIAAAHAGRLPELVELEDLRGDLQVHTHSSDGTASLEEMVLAAQERGYAYLAITDHAGNPGVVEGLNPAGLVDQMAEIDRLSEKLVGLRLLKGVEVDILEDGRLALPDEILKMLDLVVCAVHSHYDLPRGKQTRRIIRALENRYCHIFAHPTGRRIGERPPVEVDLEQMMQVALANGCFLEVNGTPDRLDLDDGACKMAKEMGLKLVLASDAHGPSQLEHMRYAVGQARRGWLEAGDVINTRKWADLQKLLKRSG